MKYFLVFTILCSMNAFGQFSTSIIDYNNVSAAVTDGGLLFNNPSSNSPGYEIPKGSGIHAFYAAAFWFGGVDTDSLLHLSGTQYSGGEDIFPGPIADSGMYTSAGYTSEYSNSIWSVYQVDIDNHILNWNQSGYTMPNSIANWPGNGDPSIGVAEQLAPYVDMNDNGVYEPSMGDYPNIRGDEARYIIMNDAAKVHTGSTGDRLGIEVHLMVYQFATNDYMNNVTFINTRVFNRGNTSYSSFKTTFWGDADLGNFNDDYFGSDASRNLVYVYNGDLYDEATNGNLGYGANPPAIGVVSLSHVMSGAWSFTSAAPTTQSDPTVAPEFWNYMNNKWRFGDQWVYGGTGFSGSMGATNIPTNYMFNPDPSAGFNWDETTNNNPAGDRRMLMNLPSAQLLPGDEICYDFAVVFAGGGPGLFDGVVNLESNVDQVQAFFDTQDFSCETVTVGTDELSLINAVIYPNPSSGEVHVLLKEPIDQFSLKVTDVSGRIVHNKSYTNQLEVDLILNGRKGIYLIQIETDMGSYTQRVVLN